MWQNELLELIERSGDEVQGKKMAAYMKDKFKFLGIPKPQLMALIKPYIKEGKKFALDWDFIKLCWSKDYREAQYIALEYLANYDKKLTADDLDRLKFLAVEKSWWETVDSIDAFVGNIIQKNPNLKSVMLDWSICDNMWLRRISIDYQQRFKENTDTAILEKIIVNNLGSNEFFINKAIGWSLREYSKTNADWVREFIAKYRDRMNKLSITEASKYL